MMAPHLIRLNMEVTVKQIEKKISFLCCDPESWFTEIKNIINQTPPEGFQARKYYLRLV